MKLVLTIKPNAVLVDKEPIPDNLVPLVANYSKVLDNSHPDKLVVDFRASLKTPGIWRMPLSILKRLY